MKCTSSNILFQWHQPKKNKHGDIVLVQEPKRDIRWAKCIEAGPDSILHKGDEMLLSARVTTYNFNEGGKEFHNTSDASTLGFKRNGKLFATAGTILFEWLESVEETTASGIVVMRNDVNKEVIVRKALVHAAGPEAGVKENDVILIAFNKDAYSFEIDGKTLSNCGKEAVICYWPSK